MKSRIFKIVTWAVGIFIVVTAIYIMANGLGLVDSLDFGAGAYFYADIPEYERYDRPGAYHNTVPRWLCILLFLAWGWLMYRLWVWLDKRNKK